MAQGQHEAPRKKNTKLGWLIALGVIAILVVAVSIWWFGDQKAPKEAENTQIPSVTSPVPGETPSEEPEEAVKAAAGADREPGRYTTMLIVGYDAIGANTDTMMVTRFDTVEKKLNVVSLPRDTLVNIADSNKKINHIYLYEGESMDALKKGVEDILGFKVDSYAFVDVAAFEKIVDCIGGLYFDVPWDMHNRDTKHYLDINIDKGYQLLDGASALKVCRYREGYGMADIDRIGVQQSFLKAAIPQLLNLGNALKVPEIINIILDNLQTDLTFGNIKWYMTQFLTMKSEDVSFMMLPANASCAINNVSYVSIYVDKWMEMINASLNPLKREITPGDCNILYQVAPEAEKYGLTPSNYVVTNGEPIAGGLNFRKN